jgi:hypothetical protein
MTLFVLGDEVFGMFEAGGGREEGSKGKSEEFWRNDSGEMVLYSLTSDQIYRQNA